jgi:hypothetical protein
MLCKDTKKRGNRDGVMSKFEDEGSLVEKLKS